MKYAIACYHLSLMLTGKYSKPYHKDMNIKFVVAKVGKVWQVTERDGENTIKVTEHSSRSKAMNSICQRAKGIDQFYIVIPEKLIK